jgi:8-oxo-dGTP pyrophosphatase MutT (NUDIX family)
VTANAAPEVPEWLQPLVTGLDGFTGTDFRRIPLPADGGRPGAVLILLADGPNGPDVLLIERATSLRSHAGQPAFPGGAIDPEDGGPVAAALREATEEAGVDPAGVVVLTSMRELSVPVSGFVVTPVVAWWREPGPVGPGDPAEVATVVRVPLADLANPANRVQVRHSLGYAGPGFEVAGLLVWGFTAGLLDVILRLGGWERPWESDRIVPVPTRDLSLPPGTVSEDGGSVPA